MAAPAVAELHGPASSSRARQNGRGALEVGDIQGLLASGYGNLRAATYLLYRVQSPARARAWLGTLAGRLTTAAAPVTTVGTNLAISANGLKGLGLDPEDLATFPIEFLEGMATPHRSRVLGDWGSSSPGTWRWGGAGYPVDILLMLFALDTATLAAHRAATAPPRDSGLSTIAELETSDLGDREHFGFRDGISQPVIEGLGRTGPERDMISPGEFVLGYTDEYGAYPVSPSVGAGRDPQRLLPPATLAGRRDLGRNGTYLVLRQLGQDVAGFWTFAHGAAAGAGQPSAVHLAAKMVGRWPDGAPLVRSPEEDTPELAALNDFAYHNDDADGLRCPLGAHIRRANPRDSLDPRPGSEASVALVKRHRILRRGREYGPPFGGGPPPYVDDGKERGLHFVGLCANLLRQFEFVQGTWLASPKFNGLYDDSDPVVGAHAPVGGSFTIPADPFRHRIRGMPRFVTVLGGEYLFLPGLSAVRYLSSLPEVRT